MFSVRDGSQAGLCVGKVDIVAGHDGPFVEVARVAVSLALGPMLGGRIFHAFADVVGNAAGGVDWVCKGTHETTANALEALHFSVTLRLEVPFWFGVDA